ncbi:carboxylating nicotinate-nucleotide diphosphorylase [Bacillus piscicola]|uniref:carboxylating nicotinate-nucleotide diphosphorylase n=1 Tax=Bacillus piscicola TaxID=1632684 RepID=UPI001F09275A|nr:carboxylating nicotinate-nucleotide diphosphorylase [Bacillus piscicola]
MNALHIREKLQEFFIEDIGSGDVTTDAIFSPEEEAAGQLISKGDDIVFCGSIILQEGYKLLDENAVVTVYVQDGESVARGQVIAEVSGRTRALLSGERVLLNIVQRMSGIATAARKAVTTLADPSIRICDTRKTVPGMRMFDKYAVRMGGAANHRYGLYDAVMIKDNHIAAAGGIAEAVAKVKAAAGHMVKIEVEVTNEQEVKEAVAAQADVIMLDNCSPEKIKTLLPHIPSTVVTEASGNITLANIQEYSGCGVDMISLGSLTHSVKAADISMLLFSPTTKSDLERNVSDERIREFSRTLPS